jgi:hypothetical protein
MIGALDIVVNGHLLGRWARLAPTARNAAQATIDAVQGASGVFDRQSTPMQRPGNQSGDLTDPHSIVVFTMGKHRHVAVEIRYLAILFRKRQFAGDVWVTPAGNIGR